LKWNLLVDRPIDGSNCEQASYTQPEPKTRQEWFISDADDVLQELCEIAN
jgi:hypothetical protein